jgi:hypothetical protein
MSESELPQKYLVRDPQGNVYGPADAAMLRDWVAQGRIVPGMHIAPQETREWAEVSQHPALMDLFEGQGPVAPTHTDQPTQPARAVTVQPWGSQDPDPRSGPKPIGPVTYETPQPPRPSVLSRIAMILGITSPCLMVAGCIPVCGCFFIPLSILLSLAAIVLGIVGFATAGADRPRAKTESTVAIIGGGVTVLMVLGLMMVAFVQPASRPAPMVPVAPLPAPAPVVPAPPPAPERAP